MLFRIRRRAVSASPIPPVSQHFISIIRGFVNRTVVEVIFRRRRRSRGTDADAPSICERDESDGC